jgi:hypothetical protein
MFDRFRTRYLDLLGSIYIYNEHRGYTSIDRVLEAVRSRTPEDRDFIAATAPAAISTGSSRSCSAAASTSSTPTG